jgi:hypothetical protein
MTTAKGRILLAVFASLVLALLARRPEIDTDIYWHLALGRDLFDHINPYVDTHSFTYAGERISSLPWMFEGAAYWFYAHAGGREGLQLLKTLIWILAIAAFTFFSTSRRLPLSVTLGSLAFLVYGFAFRPAFRPDTLTVALFPLLLAGLYHVRSRWRWSHALILSVALVIWENWHSSVMLADLAVLAAFAERGITAWKTKRERFSVMAAQLAVILLPQFLNSGFHHPLISVARLDARWGVFITELSVPGWINHTAVSAGFLALSAAALAYAVFQKKYFEIFYLLGFGSSELRVTRMIPIDLLILTPVIAELLADALRNFSPLPLRKPVRVLLAATLALLPLLAVQSVASLLWRTKSGPLPPASDFPVALEKEGQSLKLSGNVFNDFSIGGWVMFFFPDLKVFIDGRTNILYPFEHLDLYEKSADLSWKNKSGEPVPIDYVLGAYDGRRELLRSFALSHGFGVQWLSSDFLLLSKREPTFPSLTSAVEKPQCFRQIPEKTLSADLERAEKFFGKASEIHAVLEGLRNIREIPKTKNALEDFVRRNAGLLAKSDLLRRIFASECDRRGLKDDALNLLLSASKPLNFDYLYALKIARETGKNKLASELLRLTRRSLDLPLDFRCP